MKWTILSKGHSVDEGYRALTGTDRKEAWWKFVWDMQIRPRHSIITWLVLKNKLRLKSWLMNIGVLFDDTCSLCGIGVETRDHVFFECPFSQVGISGIHDSLQLNSKAILWQDWIAWCLNVTKGRSATARERRRVLNAMIYELWSERNQRVFEKKASNP